MIVPQMQQRWTGYSSEGSRSLLDGVLGARQASVNERQAGVSEANQQLKEGMFADQIALRKAKAKLKKGQSVQKINKLISDEGEVDRDRWKKKWVKNKTGFLHHPWRYIWDREGLIAEHQDEFDSLVPRQKFAPDISQIIGQDENVSIDPSQVGQYIDTESMDAQSLLDLIMLNQLGE
tara:strand:+ start:2105 stop:2638 length:534 start_codon:yes stop_codon:yes gene_type:complete